MLILDTHIWIWFVSNDKKLNPKHHEQLKIIYFEKSLCLSDISLWEVSMLYNLKKIQLKSDFSQWLNDALPAGYFKILPINREIAEIVSKMPDQFTKDPADRIIAATAISRNCPLLTYDQKIIDSGLVNICK